MEAAAEVLEPGSSVHVYAAHTQVRTWHYPESLSRRIKTVSYLRNKRPAGSEPTASVEWPALDPVLTSMVRARSGAATAW